MKHTNLFTVKAVLMNNLTEKQSYGMIQNNTLPHCINTWFNYHNGYKDNYANYLIYLNSSVKRFSAI